MKLFKRRKSKKPTGANRTCTEAIGRLEPVRDNVWTGMASLSYPPMPPIFSLLIFVFLTICLKSVLSCDMGSCWSQFQLAQSAVASGKIPKGDENPTCVSLRTHLQCIISIGHNCKDNLRYYSLKQGLIIEMNRNSCLTVGPIHNGGDVPPKPPIDVQWMCTFKRKTKEIRYRHCGLFGDPHLRTFNNEYQTCKVQGAWTLVYNQHILVQVTNQPVVNKGAATATSKLTVVIKKNEDCASDNFVMYTAQTDNLPSTFTDGRTHYGPERSVLLHEIESGRHIEIYLRYIDTTIRVQQIGRYFTFAIKMPEEIVKESENNDKLQLCLQGCPKSERIDYKKYLAEKRKVVNLESGDIAMSRDDASNLCKKAKLVDFYFDSCVFDLMTTGDTNFTVAAHQAWQDLINLSPEIRKTQKNRTDFAKYDEIHGGSTKTCCSNTLWILVLSVLISLWIS